MAQLVLPLVGSMIGASFGQEALGWVIGSVLGNLLFPPKGTTQEGPRLGDLTVSSSAYGAPIAIGFGTARAAGNIIWSSGIKEKKHVKKQKGGKGGGPTNKIITYTYSASFALGLAEGTVDRILRIWADGKTIYDKRGTGTNTSKKGLKFKLYTGSETQLPDPLIQADKTAALTPAFRGLAYIMFDTLQLADYGNRIPNITVEMSFKPPPTPSRAVVLGNPLTVAEGGLTDVFSTEPYGTTFAIDYTRGYVYTSSNDGAGSDPLATYGILRRFNLQTLVEDRQVDTSDWRQGIETNAAQNSQFSRLHVAPDGSLIVAASISGTYVVSRIDPNTYKRVASYTMDINSYVPFAIASCRAGGVDFVCIGSQRILGAGNQVENLVVLRASDMSVVYDSAVAVQGFPSIAEQALPHPGGETLSVVVGEVRATSVDIWHTLYYVVSYVGFPSNVMFIKYTIASTGVVTHSVEYSGPPSGLLPGAVDDTFYTAQTTGDGLIYDQVDGGVIFISKTLTQYYLVKMLNGAAVWTTPIPSPYFKKYNGVAGLSRLQDGTVGLIINDLPYLIDTATGELLENGGAPAYSLTARTHGVYDSNTESWLGIDNATGIPARWFFRRAGTQAVSVADIVEDICGRVGLEPSDLDVTDLLDDTVPGYIIGSRSSARSMIEPLAAAFFFDATESDFMLKFIQRGNASVRTITQPELAIVDSSTQEVLRENRQQEVELPGRLSVVYMDRDKDYQQGTQSSKRLQNPVPAMFSHNEMSLPLPMVLTTDFAKQLSEKMLYSAWTERASYQFSLSWKHLDLDPTDVITINLDGGEIFTPRLTQIEMSENFTLSLSGVSERAAQYTSTVVADGGTGPLTPDPLGDIVTRLILLDSPLLRDSDEPAGRAYNPMYFFMGSYIAGWRNGTLFKSVDTTTGVDVGQSISSMTWGSGTALGDPPDGNPYITDYVNTMRVYLYAGDVLESVTNAELLNGANPAALIKANGEVEIIQFQNVTQNDDGSFTLDTFLRGRRGTDAMCTGHSASDIFLLLVPEDAEVFSMALGERNQVEYYRAVGQGDFIEDAEVVTKASLHRPLMPYAPVNPAAALVGGDDIDLTWNRRTRVGGALMDYTDVVPLNEDTEAYEIDILDAPSGTVVRTVTGISTSAYTYTAADQATDGFTAPMISISLRVYQISAQVGRGFMIERTIDVTV